MKNSNTLGFCIHPQISTVDDLIRWNNFMEGVVALHGNKISQGEKSIRFPDLSDASALPLDGLDFQYFVCIESKHSTSIFRNLKRMIEFHFGARVRTADLSSVQEKVEHTAIQHSCEQCFRCSLCLNVLSVDYIQCTCGFRPYCSHRCQNQDWLSVQNHSKWCGVDCCQEGVHWAVQDIPGKGQGIVAKTFIPNRRRIMIDAVRAITDPVVQQLEPKDGTTLEKERLNSFGNVPGTGSILCVRVARMNHDCNSNADQSFDQDSRVMIVVANRDIYPSEEICINYTNFNGRLGGHTPQTARLLLKEKWDIECRPTCRCYDEFVDRSFQRCRELDSRIRCAIKERNASNGLVMVEELLRCLESAQATWTWKLEAHWYGFKLSIMQQDTLQGASSYGERALEMQSTIFTRESERYKEMKVFVDCPEKHKYYLNKNIARSA
jgi:hypothetical protein